SYALARYLDGWFRRGEVPPTTRAFLRYSRERGAQPVVMGWLLLGAGTVIGVNLLSLTDWYLRAANLVAAGALALIAVYACCVSAASDVGGIRRQSVTALLLGLGSLHWSVLGATGVIIAYVAMFRFAMPLLLLLGAVLPALVVALVLRVAWSEITHTGDAVPRLLREVRTDAHSSARRSDASATRPSPDLERAITPQKGISA